MKDCNTMKDLWKAAKKHPELREEALDSVAPVKALLTGVFQRFQLKDKSVQVSPAATEEQLASIWESILCIDSSCSEPNCLRRKSDLNQARKVKEFLSYCTRECHSFFELKKCGEEQCTICKPVQLSKEVFEQIKPFPDPVPGEEDHYVTFNDVYCSQTSEGTQTINEKWSQKQWTLPFHGKVKLQDNTHILLLD